MFNTVEGNSTFYGLPAIDVAKRWADESAEGFQFALKVPRLISHDAQLVGCERDLDALIQFAAVLHESGRLGPSFLQLPPTFGPDSATVLESFLDRLPGEMQWAVEVRHHDWFDQGKHEEHLNQMLRSRGSDKVLFDSRPLYQSPPDDEIEAVSQTRKPKTPVRQTVTATRPMLRLVGRNRIELVDRFINQWVPIVESWVQNGLEPFVFLHAPDDTFAPALAKRFWTRYCDQTDAPADQRSAIPELPKPPRQMGLF